MGINYVEVKLDEFAGYEDGWNGFGTRAPNKQALAKLRGVIGNRLQKGFVLYLSDDGEVYVYRQLPFDQWDDTLFFGFDTSGESGSAPLEAWVSEGGRVVKVFPLPDKAAADAFFAYLQERGFQV